MTIIDEKQLVQSKYEKTNFLLKQNKQKVKETEMNSFPKWDW